jgi:hypothetical protein
LVPVYIQDAPSQGIVGVLGAGTVGRFIGHYLVERIEGALFLLFTNLPSKKAAVFNQIDIEVRKF